MSTTIIVISTAIIIEILLIAIVVLRDTKRKIRIYITTVATLLLIFILILSNTLENNANFFGVVIKIVVFAIFVGVGRILITNIFAESERKKQVESLNKELAGLRDNLEGTVVKRTQELSESKTRSETIFENLILGVIEYDDRFTVIRINRAAERFLGIDRYVVEGNIIQPKDRDNKTFSSLATVLYPALSAGGHKIETTEVAEKGALKNELTIEYPERRDLQIIMVPLKGLYASERPRFVKLLRDVTHENLIDKSKSEFIKIAAHQLRTPLAGTKWALRATLDGDFGPIPQEHIPLLQRVYDSNKNLIDVVNDMLNVSRIEEDSGYHKEVKNISEIIEDALKSSIILAKEKNLSISFKNASPDIQPFSFDPTKLLLAIKNVIENAIDYTNEGGSVNITLKQEDASAIIVITDTGIGISDEDIPHIFTRFYRSKKILKDAEYHLGLGLSISKDIIEHHDGTITVESKKDTGTSVTIRIPIVIATKTTVPVQESTKQVV